MTLDNVLLTQELVNNGVQVYQEMVNDGVTGVPDDPDGEKGVAGGTGDGVRW